MSESSSQTSVPRAKPDGADILDGLGLSERNKDSARRVMTDLHLVLGRSWRAACSADPEAVKGLAGMFDSEGNLDPAQALARLRRVLTVAWAAGAADPEVKSATDRIKDETPGLLLAIAPALMRGKR